MLKTKQIRGKVGRRQRSRRSNGKKGPTNGSANWSSRQTTSSMNVAYGSLVKNRILNAFPLNHRCSVRYFDNIEIKGYGVTPNSYSFSANGLYDPDVSGTGHQPMGFDQLCAFFQHYTVVGASIKVQFRPIDTSNYVYAAIAVQRTSSALTSWPRLIEAGNCTYGTVAGAAFGGGPIPQWYENSVNIANFMTIPNVLNDDTLRGTAAANPATGAFFVLYVASDTTVATSCLASVQIDYEAVFTEPLQPAQS